MPLEYVASGSSASGRRRSLRLDVCAVTLNLPQVSTLREVRRIDCLMAAADTRLGPFDLLERPDEWNDEQRNKKYYDDQWEANLDEVGDAVAAGTHYQAVCRVSGWGEEAGRC